MYICQHIGTYVCVCVCVCIRRKISYDKWCGAEWIAMLQNTDGMMHAWDGVRAVFSNLFPSREPFDVRFLAEPLHPYG